MHTFWLSTDTTFSRNLQSKPRLFHGKDKIKKFRRLTLTVIPPRKSYLGFLCHVCLRRSCELHGSSEWRKTQFESTTCTWTLEALSPKLSSFHGTLFWQTVFIYLQSQEMSLNCSSKMKIINLWGFCSPFDLSSTHITSLFPQNRNANWIYSQSPCHRVGRAGPGPSERTAGVFWARDHKSLYFQNVGRKAARQR